LVNIQQVTLVVSGSLFSSWYFKKVGPKQYAYFPIAQYFSKAYIVNNLEKDQILRVMQTYIGVFFKITPLMVALAIIIFNISSLGALKYLGISLLPLSYFVILICRWRNIKLILGNRKRQHVIGNSFLEAQALMAASKTWHDLIRVALISLALLGIIVMLFHHIITTGNTKWLALAVVLSLVDFLAIGIITLYIYLKCKVREKTNEKTHINRHS